MENADLVISYNELTPEKFVALLQKNGCMLIKNLFLPQEIDHLVQETLDLFFLVKNLMHNNVLPETSRKHLEIGHPAGILPSLGSLEHVLDKPVFIECLRKYFAKEDFTVNVESTGLRRCDPHHWKNFLPWHQDILDRKDQFLTCWMPFMKIDADTPGLDLVPFKLHHIITTQDKETIANDYVNFSDELVNQKASPLRWRPQLDVGDVLIFDPYCVHRTSYDPNFKNERYSMDIRIHPKNCLPEASWKTHAISLPSTEKRANHYKPRNTMFNLRHLIF